MIMIMIIIIIIIILWSTERPAMDGYSRRAILTWRTRTGPTRKFTPSEVNSRCRHGSRFRLISVDGKMEEATVSSM